MFTRALRACILEPVVSADGFGGGGGGGGFDDCKSFTSLFQHHMYASSWAIFGLVANVSRQTQCCERLRRCCLSSMQTKAVAATRTVAPRRTGSEAQARLLAAPSWRLGGSPKTCMCLEVAQLTSVRRIGHPKPTVCLGRVNERVCHCFAGQFSERFSVGFSFFRHGLTTAASIQNSVENQ